MGSGAPTNPGGINPTAGDVYHRTDTPTVVGQKLYICTVGGASPTWAAMDSNPTPPLVRSTYFKPTAALFETIERTTVAVSTMALTSARLFVQAIELPTGTTVSSISFISGTTALATGTHAWFALFDNNRNLLGQSTDDTAPAWAANTLKTYSLTTPFVTTYEGLYWLGICVVATTPPSLKGASADSVTAGLAPILNSNTGSTGLTGTAPNPFTAGSGSGQAPYGYVS